MRKQPLLQRFYHEKRGSWMATRPQRTTVKPSSKQQRRPPTVAALTEIINASKVIKPKKTIKPARIFKKAITIQSGQSKSENHSQPNNTSNSLKFSIPKKSLKPSKILEPKKSLMVQKVKTMLRPVIRWSSRMADDHLKTEHHRRSLVSKYFLALKMNVMECRKGFTGDCMQHHQISQLPIDW